MKFGLIGYPLSHSFSQQFFTEKFSQLGLDEFSYELIPIEKEDSLPDMLRKDFIGLNITIPYKTTIIQYLNEIDPVAFRIGAVNTIVKTGAFSNKGFNTDYLGFSTSLRNWYNQNSFPVRALVLGSGGSAKAVCFALEELGIIPSVVSTSGKGKYQYAELTADIMQQHLLIINTTPLGMWPVLQACPPIPYEFITPDHRTFDLVYNPANTLFLSRCQQQGASIRNGMEMLHQQAEHAWLIWKQYGKF